MAEQVCLGILMAFGAIGVVIWVIAVIKTEWEDWCEPWRNPPWPPR